MKKIIIIFVGLTLNFSFSTFNCFAQPNGGFENWSTTFGIQEPDGWQTFNFLALTTPPNPLSAFKAIGIDVHSGSYALKLKTVFVNNNPAPQSLPDSVGYAFTGKIIPSPFAYKYGFPYTGRPEKLEFWSKYIPVGSDAARIGVFLLKWNGVSHDTIASDDIVILTTPTYTLFQSILNYYSNALPDSASIFLSPSKDTSVARVGSTLFIDDISFTGWVGIDNYNINNNKVKLFPNPAKDNVTILAQMDEADNVQVIDASGKLAGIYKIKNYTAKVNTSVFSEGIYFYDIRDNKNKTLANGKFDVTK